MLRDFKPASTEDGSGGVAIRMLCGQCSHQYDRVLMENKLLAEVNRLNATYLLQDVRCPKTHKISNRLCTAISGTVGLTVQLALLH